MRVAKVAAVAALLLTSSCAFLETGTEGTPPSATPDVPPPAPRPNPSARADPRVAPGSPGRATREVAQDPGVHRVESGETVYSIAKARGVDAYALITANKLTPPFDLTEGQRLVVPGAARQAGSAQPNSTASASRPAETDSGQPVPRPAVGQSGGPERSGQGGGPERSGEQTTALAPQARPASPLPEPPAGAGGFIWPVEGKVLSGFGPKGGGRYNDGINVAAVAGTLVHAADSGVVAYAGNELRGFGNMLLIKHAGGWVSAYAHNQVLLVSRGDRVRRGQVIARVGSTGGVDEPQLHFELRKGKRAVDPLGELPRPSAEARGRDAG